MSLQLDQVDALAAAVVTQQCQRRDRGRPGERRADREPGAEPAVSAAGGGRLDPAAREEILPLALNALPGPQ